MLDNVICFFFSNLTAYILNVRWVFKPGRHNRVVEVLLFYAVSALSALIGTPLMGLLIRYLGLMTTLAFGVNIVVAVMVNYALRKFVIFKG